MGYQRVVVAVFCYHVEICILEFRSQLSYVERDVHVQCVISLLTHLHILAAFTKHLDRLNSCKRQLTLMWSDKDKNSRTF